MPGAPPRGVAGDIGVGLRHQPTSRDVQDLPAAPAGGARAMRRSSSLRGAPGSLCWHRRSPWSSHGTCTWISPYSRLAGSVHPLRATHPVPRTLRSTIRVGVPVLAADERGVRDAVSGRGGLRCAPARHAAENGVGPGRMSCPARPNGGSAPFRPAPGKRWGPASKPDPPRGGGWRWPPGGSAGVTAGLRRTLSR